MPPTDEESFQRLLQEVRKGMPDAESAAQITKGFQKHWDKPPLVELELLLQRTTSLRDARLLLFFPEPVDMASYVALCTRAPAGAPPEHPQNKVRVPFLAVLYMLHVQNWPLMRAFIHEGGLRTLADNVADDNIYLRAQAIDCMMQLTNTELHDWFAEPTLEPSTHRRWLDLAAPEAKFVQHIALNLEDSFPGGSFYCLQILAFWLSLLRYFYCEQRVLRLGANLMQMLKKWAAAEGKPSDETELATKLVEDFSRFPTVDAMHGQLIGASGAGGATPPDGSELPKVEGVRVPMGAAATDGQLKDSKEVITPVVVGAASAAEGGGPVGPGKTGGGGRDSDAPAPPPPQRPPAAAASASASLSSAPTTVAEQTDFRPGAAVALANLQARPELNGTAGTVASWDAAKGRYAVKHTASGEALLLKPACLQPAAAAAVTVDEQTFTLRNDEAFPAALLDELRRRGLRPSDHYQLDVASGWPPHAERSMLLSLDTLLATPEALLGEPAAVGSVLQASRARLAAMWQRFCEPANVRVPAPAAEGGGGPSAAFEAWAAEHLPEALSTVAPAPIAGSGLGLLARRALRRGEVALAVPAPLLLHAGAARRAADEGGALRGLGRALRALQRDTALHDDKLTLVALLLARRAPSTTWGAYLARLGDGFGTALEWGDEELRAVAGTPLAHEVQKAREELHALHATLGAALAREEHAAVREALGGGIGWEELRWASCLVESRGIVVGVGEGEEAEQQAEAEAAAEVVAEAEADEDGAHSATCVVPVGDLLNHSPHAQLQPEFSAGALRFRCVADVPEGAQLCIDYAPPTCSEALHHYGFLPCAADGGAAGTGAAASRAAVAFEGFSVELQLPADDPLLGAKQALLAARGLAGLHWLRPGGAIAPRLRGAVRLGALSAAELAAARGGAALPDTVAAPLCFANEQRCLQLLRAFVEALRAGLPPWTPDGGSPARVYAELQRRTLREALESVQADEFRLYSGKWKLPKALTPASPAAAPAAPPPPAPAAAPAAPPSAAAEPPAPAAKAEESAQEQEQAEANGTGGPQPEASDSAPAEYGAAAGMRHELCEVDGALRLSVALPGVSSLGEIEVDLSATEVVLTRRDGTALRVPMPRPVSAEQAKAKFSRKQQRLTVTLPFV